MADWVTISSLASAGSTIVLAIATFSSVRSANRSARTAERALQAGLRAVLVPSRPEAPEEKMRWVDGHWTRLPGGQAHAELEDGVIYLAISVRNVGAGLGVLHGWHLVPWQRMSTDPHADPSEFRRQTRDLYVPTGDTSYWQAAIRDEHDELFGELATTIDERKPFSVDLLYSDHEGGQRTISRFLISPMTDKGWFTSVGRHWNVDRADPR